MLLDVHINPKLVRTYVLLDPIEERPNGAWMFEYHGQAFLTDPGGGNPVVFSWSGQARQPIGSRARSTPPLTGFDVMTEEEIAGELRINPALLSFVGQSDPTFPPPILRFSDGPIWDREAVERWLPTRQSQPARRWSQPIP